VPELGSLGSVRGALSNERPYRSRPSPLSLERHQLAERRTLERLSYM